MSFVYVSSAPVPASNNTHTFVLLATIHRIAGKDSIESSDITDERLDLQARLDELDVIKAEVIAARTSAVYGAKVNLTTRIQQVENEVNLSRGTHVSLDARLDIALENNGDLKLETQETTVSKKINTQVINFDHGLDVTDSGGKTIKVDIDESELNANLIPNVPAGKIAAVTIQTALNELDNEKVARDGTQELTANWDVGNFEVRARTFNSDVATGTPPLLVSSSTKVDTLNADQVDGKDAGNADGNIPISNGTVNTNLNADKVDGKDLPNSIANILNDHNKTNHDSLGIDAATLGGSSKATIISDARSSGNLGLVIEARNGSDPGSPVNGQIWLRTDL
jgi:hypothetical protein